MYTLLERHIEQPEFLRKLESAKEGKHPGAPGKHGDEVLHEQWWEPPTGCTRSSAEGPLEDFTEVNHAKYLPH